jgi:hypothetical protein
VESTKLWVLRVLADLDLFASRATSKSRSGRGPGRWLARKKYVLFRFAGSETSRIATGAGLFNLAVLALRSGMQVRSSDRLRQRRR